MQMTIKQLNGVGGGCRLGVLNLVSNSKNGPVACHCWINGHLQARP